MHKIIIIPFPILKVISLVFYSPSSDGKLRHIGSGDKYYTVTASIWIIKVVYHK